MLNKIKTNIFHFRNEQMHGFLTRQVRITEVRYNSHHLHTKYAISNELHQKMKILIT